MMAHISMGIGGGRLCLSGACCARFVCQRQMPVLIYGSGVAYGHFSSELVANPSPGAKGLPGGRKGYVSYDRYVLAGKY